MLLSQQKRSAYSNVLKYNFKFNFLEGQNFYLKQQKWQFFNHSLHLHVTSCLPARKTIVKESACVRKMSIDFTV